MVEAAIVRDEPISWGKNPIKHLKLDEVAILTGPRVKSIEITPDSISNILSMYLGRYTRICIVKTSAFTATREETSDSAEPLYDFRFRIDLMARVENAREFVDLFGPGKTVFDPFYDQVRGHLENLSQDFYPSQLNELRSEFNKISKEVRDGQWTAGPVQVLSCNINAGLGPKTVDAMKAIQLQNMVSDRGLDLLVYRRDTDLLNELQSLQDDVADREIDRVKKLIDLVETAITDQDLKDQILGENGIGGEFRRLLRSAEPRPGTSNRAVTDTLLPEKKKPVKLLTRG